MATRPGASDWPWHPIAQALNATAIRHLAIAKPLNARTRPDPALAGRAIATAGVQPAMAR
jgi:hypothetical protein